ncbi:protein XRP2-like [Schistocerca piceifrons]|uniref:protein XRP2-like n=1 Tax=Schistocerca piceifrons TaxID=274613 RepID=UPI001F5EC22C|nr:protein XRP2-like [Schistocerca piceifrons]
MAYGVGRVSYRKQTLLEKYFVQWLNLQQEKASIMGCLFHKGRRQDTKDSKVKEYSWDKRDKVNLKDFTVENLDNEEIWKLPGTINGQQFVIQKCKTSTVYLLDHINTITIDDCVNCKFVIGAVKGSIFLRNCKDCSCVVACGQFRSRDCRKIDVFLCCPTQPVIEASTSMHFGCYQLYYDDLEDQFHQAGLSAFNNEWSVIHDYTPVEGENNWCLLPDTITIHDYISIPKAEELKKLNLSLLEDKSVVPYTWGPHKTMDGESCLVIFFTDGQQVQRAKAFINTLKRENADCLLLLSKEVQLSTAEAEKVFRSTSYNSIIQRGPVVGLHYCGPECISSCQQVAVNIAKDTGSTGLVYVSTNPKFSLKQVESFFNFTIPCGV